MGRPGTAQLLEINYDSAQYHLFGGKYHLNHQSREGRWVPSPQLMQESQ
jgi:hypothetical protein